jgi:hypothetical protein
VSAKVQPFFSFGNSFADDLNFAKKNLLQRTLPSLNRKEVWD